MGLLGFVKRLLSPSSPTPAAAATPQRLSAEPGPAAGTLTLAELARRLNVSPDHLTGMAVEYREFLLPKRSAGFRKIASPSGDLKRLQRRILTRLLRRLATHGAARGFQPGHSIVTNALPHRGAAVLIRMDIRDFFATTTARRVRDYFARIGWQADAADTLTRLCTYNGSLPQGAPTSPRLSNLLNFRLDTRLTAMAAKLGGAYTRYADDLTFSLPADDHKAVAAVIRFTKGVLAEEGYKLHQDRKLQICRRHDRQLVTGLVVNDRVNLPRRTRRWLRAVEHRLATGRQTTLTAQQLAGWMSLREMVHSQTADKPKA